MTKRTFAELFPLLKAYRLHPFTDYSRDMEFGRYKVEHWQHDTASQVRIYAVCGEEKLLVYREDKWVGGYESHNRDTIQGFQHEGPWVAELEAYRDEFNEEIDRHLERVRLSELRRLSREEQAEAAKVSRFAEEFG